MDSDGLFGFGTRPFGRLGTKVSPVGLAGSTFGLNEPAIEVYRKGFDAGINLLFWDPVFKNMTAALLELSAEERSRIFICGISTFGGPKRIRKTLQDRLKLLKLDRFHGFMLSWVRSQFRVRPAVVDTLIDLREMGLCENIGLSIHRRKLAYEIYLRKQFDIFMLRYNAAHRGLESDFLDKLDPDDIPSVMGYTTTRWGKLLERPPGWEGEIPRPGDLYRFSITHPRIGAVLMSPKNYSQLDDNLGVLKEGPLSAEETDFIRRFGDAVYLAMKKPVIGNLFERSSKL